MTELDKSKQVPNVAGEGMSTQHRWFLGIGLFFFIYLVLEGFFLIPFIVLRYGWH